MRMTVNESRNNPAAPKIYLDRARRRKHSLVVADAKNPAATDQNMLKTQVFGYEDMGICKEF